MAIPKICGIENEFGFIVVDKKTGKQVYDSGYRKVVYGFVAKFLENLKNTRYDSSRETPLKGIVGEEKKPRSRLEISIEEILHRLRLRTLGSVDGFLQNGARFYLDDEHPEYSTPECLAPLDLVVHDKASELAMMKAQDFFSRTDYGEKYNIFVHKNNSDGYGKSYGCHLNVLLSRGAVSDEDKFRYLVKQYLPFQIARLVLIGGGKIGAENNSPPCDFQISQRSDFFECIIGVETVICRPIFNLRDEPHADPTRYFRLHDISTDSLMCEEAIFLRAALTQIVLAMIEDKFLEDNWFPSRPAAAIKKVSRDLKFNSPIGLTNGKKITGLELLRRYLLKARQYLNQKPMSEQHAKAVDLAFKLLDRLEKDWRQTFGRLDWTTALGIAKSRPASRKANILRFREVSSRGLYYQLLERGKIHRIVDDAEIVRGFVEAPADTRAYLRSLLVRGAGGKVKSMSWAEAMTVKNDDAEQYILDKPMLDKDYYAEILSKLVPLQPGGGQSGR